MTTPSHNQPPADAELPENWEELLNGLHQEFYSGPKVHADAFRILPKVIAVIKREQQTREIARKLATGLQHVTQQYAHSESCFACNEASKAIEEAKQAGLL